MKTYLISFFYVVVLAVSPLYASAQTVSELERYVQQMLRNNPELKAAYADYRAARERITQATSLPDPKLSYGHFIESVETRVGPQRYRLGVAQAFPWFGTLSLKGDIASAEARAEFARFTALRNQLITRTVTTYAELAYLKAAQRITKANLQLVQSWESVLRERFRSGGGAHKDLVLVQVELGSLEEQLYSLDDQQEPLRAAFNALLEREFAAKVTVSTEYLETADSIPEREITFERVQKGNPELAMWDAVRAAKSAGIALSRKQFYPDFSLGMEYIATGEMDNGDGGDDALLGMLSVDLPLYLKRNEAAVAESKFRNRSAVQGRRAKELQLRAALAKLEFQMRDTARKLRLFQNTLVPKAKESIAASYTAYESGEGAFLDVIQAEKRLLEYQLVLARAQADRLTTAARLDELTNRYSAQYLQAQEDDNED